MDLDLICGETCFFFGKLFTIQSKYIFLHPLFNPVFLLSPRQQPPHFCILSHNMPLLTTPPARKLSPSLSLWYLPMRSVVGGLMFSQVGEGHFSQMDMSCGAMPSQLHWREPWGLERSKPGRQWEKGELSLARRGSPAPWAKLESRKGRNQDKEMDRGQKRWQSWWQTNIKKEKKKKNERERSCTQWTVGSQMGPAQKPISGFKITFDTQVLMYWVSFILTLCTVEAFQERYALHRNI